jgi:hypothetical protein
LGSTLTSIMKLILVPGLLALALTTSFAAEPQFGLGLDYGVYLPTSASLKTAFGKQWTRIGISPVSISKSKNTRFDFDMNIISRSQNGNRLTMYVPSFGLVTGLKNEQDIAPYFALRGGPTYVDYRISSVSKREWLVNTNAELGFTVRDRLRFYARYDLFTKRNGLDFSGFSINASVLAFRF